jgi:hypothetical protein
MTPAVHVRGRHSSRKRSKCALKKAVTALSADDTCSARERETQFTKEKQVHFTLSELFEHLIELLNTKWNENEMV